MLLLRYFYRPSAFFLYRLLMMVTMNERSRSTTGDRFSRRDSGDETHSPKRVFVGTSSPEDHTKENASLQPPDIPPRYSYIGIFEPGERTPEGEDYLIILDPIGESGKPQYGKIAVFKKRK